jgi:syntaxin 18
LNEADWQKFEDEAESIIRKCAETIRQLKEKTFAQHYSTQYREHLENVFYLLEKYLKDVCKFYSEQKAIRVKRVVEKKNL